MPKITRLENGCEVMEGVTPEDYPAVLAWYTEKAEQGDAFSQSVMGTAYEEGLYGVTKDYTEALKWYIKAAEQGNALAQWKIGYFYENGFGLAKDTERAKYWYAKAIETDPDFAV